MSSTGFYQDQAQRTEAFVGRLNRFAVAQQLRSRYSVSAPFSGLLSRRREAIRSSDEIDPKSMEHFRALHKVLLERGIYLGPSGCK